MLNRKSACVRIFVHHLTQPSMINILIADDHQLLIDGIKTTLTGVEDIHPVGQGGEGVVQMVAVGTIEVRQERGRAVIR